MAFQELRNLISGKRRTLVERIRDTAKSGRLPKDHESFVQDLDTARLHPDHLELWAEVHRMIAALADKAKPLAKLRREQAAVEQALQEHDAETARIMAAYEQQMAAREADRKKLDDQQWPLKWAADEMQQHADDHAELVAEEQSLARHVEAVAIDPSNHDAAESKAATLASLMGKLAACSQGETESDAERLYKRLAERVRACPDDLELREQKRAASAAVRAEKQTAARTAAPVDATTADEISAGVEA